MPDSADKIDLLLVDDEVEFLDATARALGRRGFVVRTAENGRRALELLLDQAFDAIVLDVKMPGPDGVEVFHRVKSRHPELPVIMLTGHGTVQQAFETSREGVYEYLSKPCDMDKLAAVVHRAVARRGRGEDEGDDARTSELIRVLMVDHELDFLQAVAPALQRRGMRVIVAFNTAEAIEEAERQPFDVAVIDIGLPGANGAELLRRIAGVRPLTQMIVLSGRPSMDKLAEAQEARVFAFLVKPQGVEALARKIREAHAQREQRAKEIHGQQARKVLEEFPD